MLTLQVGQCGNQLGRALFDALAGELGGGGGGGDEALDDSSAGLFFRAADDQRGGQPAVARAVLVDMEPKVVQQCLQPAAAPKASRQRPAGHQRPPLRWAYDRRNALTRQSGSGNNWALGFAALGAQAEEDLLARVQAEAERCDLLRGLLTLQSAAGGTGAGLGSRLGELLADEFGACARLNAVVWPLQAGEVIVQNYNAVLTTASLVDAAHGVLLLQNDVASAACQRLLRIAHPSFAEMNGVLAAHLAAALLPVDRAGGGREFPFTTICRELCAHPVRWRVSCGPAGLERLEATDGDCAVAGVQAAGRQVGAPDAAPVQGVHDAHVARPAPVSAPGPARCTTHAAAALHP